MSEAPVSPYTLHDMLAHPRRWLADRNLRWIYIHAALLTLLTVTMFALTLLFAYRLATLPPAPFEYVSVSIENPRLCAGDALIVHEVNRVTDVPRIVGVVDTIWSMAAEATVQADTQMTYLIFVRARTNHPTYKIPLDATLPPGDYEWRTAGTDFIGATAAHTTPFTIIACSH